MRYRAIAIMLLFFLAALGAFPQSLGSSNSDIRQLQDEFIRVVREKNTAKFLTYIGKHGVAFGVDGDLQRRSELASQFRNKTGAYCYLFDSACLTREANRAGSDAKHHCSVSEVLIGAVAPAVETTLSTYEGKPQALISITPKNPPCSGGDASTIPFVLMRFNEGWKLVAVPYL